MSLILFSCNNMYNDLSKENEVSFNFKIDLKNYGGNYNYVEATVYDASKIKIDGEYKYSNIDFSSLPNGYSSKHEIGVGEQVSFEILNVPKNLRAIVVVELLNTENRVTTVVYGGISDIFTVSKNAKYSLNLEKMTQTSVGLTGENVIYKVEHYQQNLKDENYTLIETEYKEGLNSNKATDSPREYQGFYTKDVQLSNEGTVVKVYYDRNTFTVNLNTDEGILENTELTVKYGERLDNNLKPTKEGYYFIGWYQDEEFATTFDFSTKIDKDYVLFAKWIDLAEGSCTSSDVSTFIQNLTGEGPHYVKVTGAITDSTILNIRSAMNNNASALVILDLSETTGLTSLYEYHKYSDCSPYSCPSGSAYCRKYDFNGIKNLVSITLPNTVTSLSSGAFYNCSGLENIEIPESVTTIGTQAFYGASSLKSVKLPESITSIGASAFAHCTSLTSIELPESVTSIGDRVFYCCSNLEAVKLPEGTKTISEYFFSGCTNLKSITIPSSVTTISVGALNSTPFEEIIVSSDNPNYMAIDNCLYTKDGTTLIKSANITSIVLPSEVTTVSDYAFYNCDNLQNVELPESITKIGQYAFYDCDNLQNVELPESITKIEQYSFYDCNNLKYITMPCVENIGTYAFYKCNSLESLEMPVVTDIDDYAFQYCISLNNVDFGDKLKSIGVSSFESCVQLTRLILPNSTSYMYASSFKGCSFIEYLDIPGPWYGHVYYFDYISINELIRGQVTFTNESGQQSQSFTGILARSSGYFK